MSLQCQRNDHEARRITRSAGLSQRLTSGAWVEKALRSHGCRGKIIDSRTFIRNVDRLSRYVEASK